MPIEFRHALLPNGLRVIGEVDPGAHTAAIGFFVKTGSRDEEAAIMGVSHFLEHMMFKGTEQRSAEEVDRQFDAIGANHNAYTTAEITAFYAHTLPEHLAEAESILSDIMRPALRAHDFQDEKKVIIEEIAMYRDQPFWVLYERAMEVYFGAHPLSHRVLGTEETVTAMRPEQMREYFHHRYSADNTIVSLAGCVDFDAMVGRLEEHCGRWVRTDARRAGRPAVFTPQEFTLRSRSTHLDYILMFCPAPAMADDRRYAAGMLMQILGDDEGSRLYWALIDTGLAEEAEAQYTGHDGVGQFVLHAACAPANGPQVESVLGREIAALPGSLSEDDLEREKSKIATAVTLQGELPAGRMRRLGRIYTALGEYRSLEEELRRINAVTLEDLRAVAREFPMDRMVVGRLGPEA